MTDPVDHPTHYTQHPSGVECIQVTEHMGFLRGSAVKYLWRAGLKGGPAKELEDIRKARWYVDREIRRLEGAMGSPEGGLPIEDLMDRRLQAAREEASVSGPEDAGGEWT